MRSRSRWPWALSSFAAGLSTAAILLWIYPQILPTRKPLPAGEPTSDTIGSQPTSYADAVLIAGPSVVNIFSTKVRTDRNQLAFQDRNLQRHFRSLLPERLQSRPVTSLGSGVILSEDGLLLTNRHIVYGADEMRVVLANGRNLDAKVVGYDPETDLAVLKASDSKLPAIPIGRPSELRVGDVVLAIGNPFGVGQTVTLGIVGATGRTRLGISSIENFIQTDAAINPGNSGGALINSRGELIGINTAIFSKSGGSEGIGFAIPVDLAMDVTQQIVTGGQVVRGWIGIVGRSVTPQLAESFGLRVDSGVLVSSTLGNSPAEQADLRPGDVVTKVNGKGVASTNELLEAITKAGPGARTALEIWRGSERIEAHTITVERPSPGDY